MSRPMTGTTVSPPQPRYMTDSVHSFINYNAGSGCHALSRCLAFPLQVFGHIIFLANEKRIYKNVLKMTYGW